uniref:Disease resistance RPP13-like protein 1 n=1 Tax=Manihot esculenta TaxID=3983 RepID=A0A2C9UZ40_MANES
MAAALIGGSFLSAFLQLLFDRMASPEVVDFFKGQKLDDRLLKKLNITLNSIVGVLDDAEEKQITKPAVKNWLTDLKDAAYEADDLLDEIASGALQSKHEVVSPRKKVRNFFSSRNPFKKGVVTQLEEILERLEYLVKQKDAFGLREGIGEKPSYKIPTTSLVDESGTYGRDDDKEAIVKLLLSDDGNGNSTGVIPIVGMGGLGKTTLAQLVYSDERVAECFQLKSWVCVSEEFDVSKVTKDILEGVTRKKCDTHILNQLQLELEEVLMNKKFLLILDDVWNDNYADWDILRMPLKSGAKGSKIIVTTRNESVALVMRTVPTHHLKELNADHCWSLFAKHAFDDGNPNALHDLEAIGREIVRKCKGLPLAAKTMGGLLRSKTDVEEWEKVLNSKLWNLTSDNIFPALRLSYHYLPSHLKQCFAYCAMFPKDYNFKKQELVFLWMAEGLLVQSQGNKELEEVGEEYFNILVSRTLFQLSTGNQSGFVMHDLIHDLAILVSGEFSFRLEADNSYKIARIVRHLSYTRTKHDAADKFEAIYEAKFLRTLFPVELSRLPPHKCIDNEVMQNLLLTFGRLRVLSLSQYDNIIELPNSIGNLRHLRYLDLSSTSIERLPEVVSSLYNLQTLILHECKYLAVLPDSIGNLSNVRYLNLFRTSIRRLPESMVGLCNLRTLILQGCRNLVQLPTNMGRLICLNHLDIGETKLQEMPLKMGRLTKLQTLTDFVLGKQSGSNIKELGELQDLQGQMCIRNLQNIVDIQDALEANLKAKRHLKVLTFRWNGETENPEHDREVLEQLHPQINLECLYIFGYGGTEFPSWVGFSSFSNIVCIELNGCRNCTSIPPLGQLASLKQLSIIDFPRLVVIGPEFYGSCLSMQKPFGSLEILSFERMLQWHELVSFKGGAFPLLQELYVRECPNLRKVVLSDHLPSLTTLKVVGCQKLLVASLPSAPRINEMRLYDDSRDWLVEKLSSGMHRLTIGTFQSLDTLYSILELKRLPSGLHRLTVRGFQSIDALNLLMEQVVTLSVTVDEIEIEECDALRFLRLNSSYQWTSKIRYPYLT